ncbi:DNA adenine methylase [Variovorax sp.]|uniref:DNA adenine methylase n=1 Tax=Variovorax sp. TaxID=1871043 RepID=UPI003BAC48BF
MTPLVQDIMGVNELAQCIYCEPFAGGAGIACRLLVAGAISEAWINDIDPAIFNFWDSVLTATDDLCELIQTTPVTIEEWHRQRAIQHKARVSKLALGFSTLFLNRTNRSGILKGGVIGGLDQSGNYLLDCRFNRADLIRKVRRLAIYRDQIRLTCQDARLYIGNVVRKLPDHSLVNIDPPYFDKGPELYTSFYTAADHASLAKAVRGITKPWMLTYDDVPAIRQLYGGLPGTRKALNYTAQVKKVGVELLVMSPMLKVPETLQLDPLPLAA